MPTKAMSAPIKRFERECGDFTMIEDESGPFVLHTDHLASHAFDTETEMAAFEDAMRLHGFSDHDLARDGIGMYRFVQSRFIGWIDCAKSRAKRNGANHE